MNQPRERGPSERHTFVVRPDGSVVVPDLADAWLPVLNDAPEPCDGELTGPRLALTKAIRLPLPDDPAALPEPLLWRWHARGAARYRRDEAGGEGVSWLAVKQALAERLLGPGCRLCARRCAVDRRAGERGVCGLGATLRATAPVRLWGEEPELGRPGLAVAAGGCGLRCKFCYRADLLAPGGVETPPETVAAWLDATDDVRHVHWLGGDPDESLPAILAVHAAVRRERPVVWNSHSYLTPAAATLLEGVVDGFVADLKFGPGACAERVAGVRGYWPAATATLARWARTDALLIVRHVVLPGHVGCCAEPVVSWVREHLPHARLRVLTQYEPLGPAADDVVLGRRLSPEEQTAAARLGADTKDG